MNEIEQVKKLLNGRNALMLYEFKGIIKQSSLHDEVVLWGKYVITRNKAVLVVDGNPNDNLNLEFATSVQLWSTYTDVVKIQETQGWSSWIAHTKCPMCGKKFSEIIGNEWITPQGLIHDECKRS